MKVNILKNSNNSEIIAQYDKSLVTILKSVKNSKYNPDTKRWKIDSSELKQLVNELKSNNFEVNYVDHICDTEDKENEVENIPARVQFGEHDFSLIFPIPKVIYAKFYSVPKLVKQNIWTISNDHFYEFYKICMQSKITLLC